MAARHGTAWHGSEALAASRARTPAHNTDPDGDVYEGEFRFGRREGRGKYKYSKGECYEVAASRHPAPRLLWGVRMHARMRR